MSDILKKFEHNGKIIYVNDTEEDVAFTNNPIASMVLHGACDSLVSLDDTSRASISAHGYDGKARDLALEHKKVARDLIVAHERGDIVLTPSIFCWATEDKVTKLVARQFVEDSPIGRNIVADLSKSGLFGFLNHLSESARASCRSALSFILASLIMSISGAKALADIPAAAFLAWISYFREPGGARWRTDQWGSKSDIYFQCLREVAFAYSRFTNDDTVADFVRQRRIGREIDGVKEFAWSDITINTPSYLKRWLELFIEWRKKRPTSSAAYRQMFLYFVSWLTLHFKPNEIEDVGGFLASPNRASEFGTWLISTRQDTVAASSLGQFLRYGLRYFQHIVKDLHQNGDGRTFYPFIFEDDIVKVAQNVRPRPTESTSRPLPMRLYRLTEEILAEGEKGWPGTSSLCRSLVPLADGSSKLVYCPALSTMFRVLFHLPARLAQIKRLDSGEGDLRTFNAHTMAWEENRGPVAGYWEKTLGLKREFGYALEFKAESESVRPFTGFYLNTNKHQPDQKMPWEDVTVHRALYDLKLWQQQYLPISQPIEPKSYIDRVGDLEAGKLEDYPKIFPLFRVPMNARAGKLHSPPTIRQTNEFWYYVMAELERRTNEGKPDKEKKYIVTRNKKGYPVKANYTINGIRSANLTLMYVSGVPFEIISRQMAGHLSDWITNYYVKLSPTFINEHLSEAAQRRDEVMAKAFIRDLADEKISAAQLRAASLHPDPLVHFRGAEADQLYWFDVSIGLCPFQGTRCDEGGIVLRKDTRNGVGKHVYGPVKGGKRNCVMCRFFVTGEPWINAIWLYANKLGRSFALCARRIDELTRQLVDAQEEAGRKSGLKDRIERIQSEITAASEQQRVAGESFQSAGKLVEIIIALSRRAASSAPGISTNELVANGSLELTMETTSEFALAAGLTAGSRVYPILHDDETENARNAFLDKVMWNTGLTPLTLPPLPEDVRRRGQDAMADFLMRRTTYDEQDALIAGKFTLNDLELQSPLLTALGEAMEIPEELVGRWNRPLLVEGRAS